MDPKKIGNIIQVVKMLATAALTVLIPAGVVPADWIPIAIALGFWSLPNASAIGAKLSGGDK